MTKRLEAPKFTQLAVGQYRDSEGNLNYAIVALGEDGCVYNYRHRKKGWEKYTHRIATNQGGGLDDDTKQAYE